MHVPGYRRKSYAWRWTTALGGLAVLAFALATSVVVAPSEHVEAASFVVDNLDDDAALAKTACTAAANDCSLRGALSVANANGLADTITFAAALSGTITIGTTLPISEAGFGTTIAGPADHSIVVNGAPAADCFSITSDGNTIRNLVINSCGGDGIEINNADGNAIAGNRIGTNGAGTAPVPNFGDGVNVIGTSTLNTIGGTAAADGNLISGNVGSGIEIGGTANTNTIRGNYIGSDVTGSAATIGNSVGINLSGVTGSNTIRGNVIGGNTGDGIVLGGGNNNLLLDNSIGLGADGLAVMGNSGDGIENTAGNNTIGGTGASDPNTIAHNTGAAVSVMGGAASIRQNRMFLNAGVGIVNPAGPPAPTIPVAAFAGGIFTIGGTAPPFSVVEVFLADPGGDEGQTYVQSYTADGAGNWGGQLCVTGPVAIAASATDTTLNNTSAFSFRNLPTGTCGGAPTALFIEPPGPVPPEVTDFKVIVVDLDGRPIQGETVECSLSPVGGPLIVVPQTATTGSDGRATFFLVPTGASWVPGEELTLTCFLDSNPNVQGTTTIVIAAYPDTDGDGVPDALDSCPYAPEDADGFQDADGCPEADNDMDGICDPWLTPALPACDGSDLCPNVAEDYDGFEDGDGCPEADNDGDGFPDSADDCPGTDWTAGPDGVPGTGDEPLDELGVPIDTREDYDGVIDTDGCHDSPGDDYDGDGITDDTEVFIYGTDPTNPDTDGDGCAEGEEVGADPLLGGTRDPTNKWDFYDVPVPTLHVGGTMNDRDKAVSLFNDVLGVLEYSGTIDEGPPTSAGRDYDDDRDGDTVDDGIAYDRDVGAPWPELGVGKSHSGPPDGAVTLFDDVLLVLAQSGHSCQAAP